MTEIADILPHGVTYNPEGQMIDSVGISAPNQRILCVRSWGRCLEIAKGDIQAAGEIQDRIGQFVTAAINEKLERVRSKCTKMRLKNISESQRTTKILHLTLKKTWFDLIERGEKREEYREIKPYWKARLCEAWDDTDLNQFKAKKFHLVKFRNGYSKSARTITFLVERISVGEGNPDWGAESGKSYFRIELDQKVYR